MLNQGEGTRLEQLAAQAYRNPPPVGSRSQLLLCQEENAFRRGELATDAEREMAAGLESVSVKFIDDPCLCRVHEDPPETKPDALGVFPLSIFPGSNQRSFAYAPDAFVEGFVHRSLSALSSLAISFAINARWSVGSGI